MSNGEWIIEYDRLAHCEGEGEHVVDELGHHWHMWSVQRNDSARPWTLERCIEAWTEYIEYSGDGWRQWIEPERSRIRNLITDEVISCVIL